MIRSTSTTSNSVTPLAKLDRNGVKDFWSRLNKTTTCWLWTGGSVTRGYGQLWSHGKCYKAHRYAWQLVNGEIPSGMCVRHKCDVPSCCNPDHLELGSHADNVADRVKRGRGARGSRVGTAKLSDQDVTEIRSLLCSGVTQVEVAKRYSIHKETVSRIHRRKIYK